jgi:hypothetical protein
MSDKTNSDIDGFQGEPMGLGPHSRKKKHCPGLSMLSYQSSIRLIHACNIYIYICVCIYIIYVLDYTPVSIYLSYIYVIYIYIHAWYSFVLTFRCSARFQQHENSKAALLGHRLRLGLGRCLAAPWRGSHRLGATYVIV